MSRNLIAMSEKLKSARWAVDCTLWKPSQADLLLASSSIQTTEKERIIEFVFMKDAKKTLIGRLLIRKYVHESTNIPWTDIVLDRDRNNKPFLKNSVNPPVRFNISHNGNFAVLAGERGDVKLGVDVMKLEYKGGRPIPEFFRIMTRHFSSDEWLTITGCGVEEKVQLRMFFRHWCLKESYVKATGTGLSENLQNINFKINTKELKRKELVEDSELYLFGKKQSNWLFQETLLDNMHCVVVAISCKDLTPYKGSPHKFNIINFQSLIAKCQNVSYPDHGFVTEFLKKQSKRE